MSCFSDISISLPQNRTSMGDVLFAAQAWLGAGTDEYARFERFLSSSNTQQRHFCVPAQEIVALRGPQDKARVFEECALGLLEDAAQKALKTNGLRPEEIAGVVCTSCSCPLIPAIDTTLVARLGLSPQVLRLPIYQYGCAGGLLGLGLAGELAEKRGPILFLSVELCSLVFQKSDRSNASLVGAAIFGDGAAAMIIHPQQGAVAIVGRQSHLLPDTRHLMGYDVRDTGMHLRLDKELPGALARELPQVTQTFLKAQGLHQEDVSWWLFHPGGVKILDLLEGALELKPEQCHWARDVLTEVGNMSSATILFVAERFLRSHVAKRGDNILMVGVGPGLTLEHVLLRVQ